MIVSLIWHERCTSDCIRLVPPALALRHLHLAAYVVLAIWHGLRLVHSMSLHSPSACISLDLVVRHG